MAILDIGCLYLRSLAFVTGELPNSWLSLKVEFHSLAADFQHRADMICAAQLT